MTGLKGENHDESYCRAVAQKRFSLVRSACPVCTEQAGGAGMERACAGAWCGGNDGVLARRSLRCRLGGMHPSHAFPSTDPSRTAAAACIGGRARAQAKNY